MKVHRKIDAFRGDAALSSWIYRITFNTAMSRLAERPIQPSARSPAAGRDGRRNSHGQDPADWSSLADDQVMRGRCGAPDRGADAPAGGLSGPCDPAGHPGTVDRGGERDSSRQAADAEVASASRPSDPARAPRRLRRRARAARARIHALNIITQRRREYGSHDRDHRDLIWRRLASFDTMHHLSKEGSRRHFCSATSAILCAIGFSAFSA